jgi:DNA polymerase sigma
MFGSLSTGLALESSDMDLVVTCLKIEGRDDVVDHIRALKDYFENHDFFTNVKAIEGASIPVIKLEADLQKIRESENSSNKSEVEMSMRFLHIDITIEDSKEKKGDLFWEGIEWNEAKSHLGIKSIHLVKNYIKEYVHLKELTLCIKKLLSVKGLNSPYQGGLSSYGVIIMIVAYMNFFSLQNAWLNVSQLLIHFFEFYGSKFDERKVGIMVNRGGCYYPFNSVSECPIVIKDPLSIENNIGKNTYRISDIKAALKQAAIILENHKAKYLRAGDEELLKMEEDLFNVKSSEHSDKLLFLSKIFKPFV